MKRWKDGRWLPAYSYILTINGHEIPKEIKIRFLIRGTKVYIPSPQRCFHCQKYGHNKKFYKNDKNVQNADRQVMRIKIAKMKYNIPIAMVITPHTQEIVPNGKLKRKSLKENFKTTYLFMKPDKLKDLQPIHPKIHLLTLPSHTNGPTAYRIPNIFTSEDEWLTHTIDSLLKRLDEIKNQKSLIKIKHRAPVLPFNQMKLLFRCPPKLLLNKEMNRQFRIIGLLYHRLLNLMHLQLQTMKVKLKALLQDQNEVIMTALTRNLIVLSAKSLPLVPHPVGGMALTCRQGQEEDIYQRSPFSAQTLPRPGGQGSSGGERSPIRPPDNQKHKAQTKPSNQSKSRVTKTHL